MADQAQVTIVIKGEAQGLTEALAQARTALGQFGTQAQAAGAKAGGELASGEHKAAREASELAERMKVAAETVGLFGTESSEAVGKIFLLRDAIGDLHKAFGGLRGAIVGGAGAMLAFGTLDFGRQAVEAAQEGEQAQAAYNQALAKTPGLLAATNKSIEDNSAQATQLAIGHGQLVGLAARAAQAGLDPRLITNNISLVADLGTKMGGATNAVNALTSGQRGLTAVFRALNIRGTEQTEMMKTLAPATADARVQAVLALVAQSRLAGAAQAQANTSAGAFAKFHTAVGNLKEEVGTALLPVLTQFANALTALLSGLEHAAAPFGGLANVLKTFFIPMLILGLKMFLGLRGTFTSMVDLLLGRVKGAMTQTAESMGEADAEAKQLATDIDAIPTTVTTTALFIPATAIKDAYKANIFSIPPEWTTRAIFEPAAIPAEEPAIPIGAKADEAAVVSAVDEAAAEAEAEAQKKPATIPVLLQEASGGSLASEIGLFLQKVDQEIATRGGITVPTHLVAPNAAQLSSEATKINALMTTAGGLKVPFEVTDQVTGRLGTIYNKAQAFIRAHPLKWVVSGVGQNAAMGGGFAVAGQLFENAKFDKAAFSGDLKFAGGKLGLSTAPTWTAKDEANLEAMRRRLEQPLNVNVVKGKIDFGPLGSGLVGLTLTPGDKTLLLQQIAAAQKNKDAATAYAQALKDAAKNPIPVKIAFDWGEVFRMIGEVAVGTIIANLVTKFLDPSKLLNVLKGAGGKILDFLRGPEEPGGPGTGGKVIPFPGGGSPEGKTINDLMSALSVAAVAVPTTSGAGKGSIPVISGLGDLAGQIGPAIGAAFGKINWGTVIKWTAVGAAIAAAIAAAIFLGIPAVVGAALAGIGVLLAAIFGGSAQQASAATLAEAKKAGLSDTVAKAYVQNSNKALLAAHQQAAGQLQNIGSAIIDSIIDGVKSHWPAIFPWPFGGHGPKGLRDPEYVGGSTGFLERYIPYKGQSAPSAPPGWQYILEEHKSDRKMWYDLVQKAASGSGGGKFGGLARMDPALLAQASALIQSTSGRAQPPAHHTFNATFHITGAQNPQATARQIEKTLEEFVSGAKAQRRLAG